MAKRSSTVTHRRSADTGRYVTEDYAKKHPKTTVNEHDKKTPAKKK